MPFAPLRTGAVARLAHDLAPRHARPEQREELRRPSCSMISVLRRTSASSCAGLDEPQRGERGVGRGELGMRSAAGSRAPRGRSADTSPRRPGAAPCGSTSRSTSLSAGERAREVVEPDDLDPRRSRRPPPRSPSSTSVVRPDAVDHDEVRHAAAQRVEDRVPAAWQRGVARRVEDVLGRGQEHRVDPVLAQVRAAGRRRRAPTGWKLGTTVSARVPRARERPCHAPPALAVFERTRGGARVGDQHRDHPGRERRVDREILVPAARGDDAQRDRRSWSSVSPMTRSLTRMLDGPPSASK